LEELVNSWELIGKFIYEWYKGCEMLGGEGEIYDSCRMLRKGEIYNSCRMLGKEKIYDSCKMLEKEEGI